MYHLWRNEMYRLGDNAPKSYVVHRRLTIKEPQPKDETSTVEKEPNLPKVISGTDGLKDYLGCSHNKAFDIIKSRILPKDVQYKTGNVWKFNRAKLDKFISENPEILGKVRAKGRLDE